jgi:EAL domain-containing protein (putative c-di-GMP-specific phosphodiesterase class I)
VVAEGVETAVQAALVRQLGCDQQQGYYYSKPLAPENLEPLLRERLAGAAPAASGY